MTSDIKKKVMDHDPNDDECTCGDCEKDFFPSRYEAWPIIRLVIVVVR